jgi:TetR/AcrR family transcriptional regulator
LNILSASDVEKNYEDNAAPKTFQILMARPRARDYEEKRSLILEQAVQLFAEQGYANSSITQLALRCGSSKASLYHYFDSKDAVLFEIFNEHTQRLLKVVSDVKELVLEPEEQFREFLQQLLRIYESAQNTHLVLLYDLNRLAPEQYEIIASRERQVVSELAAILDALCPELLKQQPELRKPLAMTLMGMINWTFTWLRKDGPVSHEKFAELAGQVFLHGISGLN